MYNGVMQPSQKPERLALGCLEWWISLFSAPTVSSKSLCSMPYVPQSHTCQLALPEFSVSPMCMSNRLVSLLLPAGTLVLWVLTILVHLGVSPHKIHKIYRIFISSWISIYQTAFSGKIRELEYNKNPSVWMKPGWPFVSIFNFQFLCKEVCLKTKQNTNLNHKIAYT